MKIINSFDIRIAIFQKTKWIYLQVIHSSSSWCWNIFPHFEFQIKEKWERYPSNNNKKSKWKNQFKIRLTGLKERVQKMNELEEWETIYKEIVCNRITYFHFSHSLRFLFILVDLVMTQEITEDTLCPRTKYRISRQFALWLNWYLV